MVGVKDIVEQLNIALGKSFLANKFTEFVTHGISETVVSKNQSFPVFFKRNDGTWAGFDDRKSVIVYHKMNMVRGGEVKGSSYGDTNTTMANNYDMTMVVYFNAGKVKLKRDEMFTFIQAVLPEFLKAEKFSYIRTGVTGAILNSQQVFQQEYRGIAYSLKPEQSLISLNYTIEGRFKKGCFNCCPE